MKSKLQVVLTGGIASGKSSVCAFLRKSGFEIIDADEIAHEVLDEKAFEIGEIFGQKFVRDGKVDRKKLGKLIFASRAKRELLESVLHGDIQARISQRAQEYENAKQPYVADIPLFFERDGAYVADITAVVYASKDEQIKRVRARNGLSEAEATQRVEAGLDIELKKQAADIVIDNSKDLAHLESEVKKFIKILKDKYAS